MDLIVNSAICAVVAFPVPRARILAFVINVIYYTVYIRVLQ